MNNLRITKESLKIYKCIYKKIPKKVRTACVCAFFFVPLQPKCGFLILGDERTADYNRGNMCGNVVAMRAHYPEKGWQIQ